MRLERFLGYIFILYGIVSPISLSATNIVLGVMVVSGFALFYNAKINAWPRINARLLFFAFLLFSWGALTRVMSGSPLDGKAASNIWEYSPIILFPLFLSVLNVRKEKIANALLISSSIVCSLGIVQYLLPSIVYPFPNQLVRPDFNGFFSHHLHSGGFYSITTILVLSLALFWKYEDNRKVYLWIFFLLNLTGLILTMARSYYISFFLIALVLLFVMNKRWFIFGVLVFAVLFGVMLSFPNPVKVRIETLMDPNFRSNKERVLMWKAALKMFKDHPVAGVGKGNWKKEAKGYYFPIIEKEYNYDIQAFAHAHNTYLTWLAETGIIGIILFLSFWLLVVWELYARLSSVQTGSFEFSLIIGSLGSLGNLFIAGMFENNFGTSVVLLLITLLIGLSLNPSNPSKVSAS